MQRKINRRWLHGAAAQYGCWKRDVLGLAACDVLRRDAGTSTAEPAADLEQSSDAGGKALGFTHGLLCEGASWRMSPNFAAIQHTENAMRAFDDGTRRDRCGGWL